MKIREMRISDYDEVTALWGITQGLTKRSADSREGIEKYLARNPGMSLVAHVGEELVGAVLLGDDGRRGYIYHFTIKEAHRGAGLGRLLEAEVCKRFVERGIEKIFLCVFGNNEQGIAFWKATDWISRDEILVMSKLLTDDPNA